MPALTLITPNRRIRLPNGEFIYHGPIGNDRHHLVPVSGGQAVVVSDQDLVRCYADYGLTIGATRPNRHDASPPLGPDEDLDPLEKARAWFCRAFDRALTSLSTRKLDAFVREHAAKARAASITHMPSAGALRRALAARGEPHRRPTRVFRTLPRRPPGLKHFHPFVEAALKRMVAWYWSEEGRQKAEAHARLARIIEIMNRHGVYRFGADWIKLKTPSDETVRERINKAECRMTWETKYGARRARLRFAGTGEGLTATRVLEKVVIDATVADGWCAWRGETMLPLGRPTLYLAVDVYSRQVIAWFISFEPPSLYGVMALLKLIVTPNAADVWGKPNEVVVDNGWENVSPSFQEACASAGISVNWAPIATPEYKAIVERAFGTVNSLVFKKLLGGSVKFPGHVMSSLGLRPRETANITLEQMDDLLAYALRKVYPHRIHRGIARPPQLLWERGVQKGRYMVDDLPNLIAHFGQVEECTLRRSGVVTKDGMRFYDPDGVTALLDAMAKETPARERAKGSATVRVKVVVNPEDLNQCMVWDRVNKRPVFLRNLHTEFGKQVSSRWEYRQLRAFAKAENLAFKSDADRLRALNALRGMIEAMAPELRAAALKRRRKLLAAMSADAPEGSTVLIAKAPATHDGKAPTVADLPATPIAEVRVVDSVAKGVRRGGKAATEKQKRTIAAKRRAKASGAPSMETPIDAPPMPTTPVEASGGTTGVSKADAPSLAPTSTRGGPVDNDADAVRALSWRNKDDD